MIVDNEKKVMYVIYFLQLFILFVYICDIYIFQKRKRKKKNECQ